MINSVKTIDQISNKAANSVIYTQHAVANAFRKNGVHGTVTELVMGQSWWKPTKSMCADVVKACNWYIQGCENDIADGLDEHTKAHVLKSLSIWHEVRQIAYVQYKSF